MRDEERRPRLVYAVTHPVTARVLLRGQLTYMARAGFDVTVISAPGADLDEVGARDGIRTVAIPFQREIALRADTISLAATARALDRLAPDIVNASTPKAALLATTAAAALRVPSRVYLVRGLRFEGAQARKRKLLMLTERITCATADHVICVSDSVRERLVAEGLVAAHKARVLGAGSSNGVDVTRFAPTDENRARATEIRAELGIPDDAPVIGFIGRLVEDKGIAELAAAFAHVKRAAPKAILLLVGASFAGEALDPAAGALQEDPSVRVVGQVRDPAPYYAAMDVLAFGSKREGFPNVPLEAAACEVPVVGFRVTGVVDAVVDGVTGAVLDVGDVTAFAGALVRYVEDGDLRRAHGRAARARVLAAFTNERVWDAWLKFYVDSLRARGLPVPR